MVERRDELLALLAHDESEVRWRADTMRAQVPPSGPISTLSARPAAPVAAGCCLSCGDPLPTGDRFRCTHCVRAAWRVLRAARGQPSGAWDGNG